MNVIKLKGLLRNIQFSHNIGEVEYDKADLIVPRSDGKEDTLSIRFKKFSNHYSNDQQVELVGNVRSYSEKLDTGKNKVSIYVFTYFDIPEVCEGDVETNNEFELDGRICKIDALRTTENGKQNVHFILANNIISNDGKQKLNNYIPMVVWGKNAIEFAKLGVSDKVKVKGQLHSRTYTKTLENGETEIRVAHEGVVTEFEVL